MNPIVSIPTRILLGFALLAASSANADDRRDNSQMMKLVRPIIKPVEDSVVQVYSGGRPVSLGTVVSEDGYILTKRSELSGGQPIRVRLSDGQLLPARVAADRRHNDLAMLRIDSNVSLPPVRFASVAPPIASFLISPGRNGRAIGIGIMGVQARRIDHRGRLGVILKTDSSGRAIVQGVWPESGADRAGIKEGDLIIAIDGREKTSRDGVIDTLRGMFPGESVRLTILRSNESSDPETLEMDAGIREFGVMQESQSDTKVNGPRNVRLSGFDQVIQHDTVLDPDECGGPVLDTSGRVIGINIARAGRVITYSLPSSLILPEMVSMLEQARAAN